MADDATGRGPAGPVVSDERTPLLRDEEAGGAEGNQDTTVQAHASTSHPKAWKPHRWISFWTSILLMIIVIILIVLFGVYRSRKMSAPPRTSELCLAPACIHAASEFLYNLSPKYKELDPCEDFEEYVCGGWRLRHDRRPDQGAVSTLSVMADDGYSILRQILESPYPNASEHSTFSPRNLVARSSSVDEQNFDKLQQAYDACIDEEAVAKIGLKPVADIVDKIAKIFVVKDAVYEKDETLQAEDYGSVTDVLLYLEEMGISPIEQIYVGADDKDPETNVIFALPQDDIGLPAKEYYEEDDTVNEYRNVVAKVLKAVHPSKSARAAAKKLATAVVELEARLAAAGPPSEDYGDPTKAYNPMQLGDFAELAPALGLDCVIKSLAPDNYTIGKMIVGFPEYLKNVSDIVSNTPKGALQTFLIWKAIQRNQDLVEAAEILPLKQFTRKLNGQDPDIAPDRWRTCIRHVDDGLGWTLSRFFVEAAFSAKAKELGDQVIHDIKDQFVSRLADFGWMEDEVKKLAAEKVDAIVQKIGYPTNSPNITDPGKVYEYYKDLKITDTYFNNSVAVTTFQVKQTWGKLGVPVNHDEWGMTAPTVNAYYNPPGNEIVFPAGIMQFPAFGGDLPSYINYGGFGAVAGHELSHAFDNNGRHYDVNGNLSDWWTEETVKEFEKRADCFVEEYSNFTVEGTGGTVHINGKLTQGENIADAGGLSAAFASWQKRREQTPDLDLPGLSNFTQEQVFYLTYGNVWCSKTSKEYLTSHARGDPHSPPALRIKGTAQFNSRGFREAFNCPAKEPVCELW